MNDKNLLRGIFLIAIALIFGVGAFNYPIGRLERAGPGFFPLMVSGILLLLGIGIAVRSRFMEKTPTGFNLRNIAIILASLIGFALLSHVNMIAGIVFLVFVSTIAGSTYSFKRNAMVAAVLIGIAFVFQYGLGLQLPLF